MRPASWYRGYARADGDDRKGVAAGGDGLDRFGLARTQLIEAKALAREPGDLLTGRRFAVGPARRHLRPDAQQGVACNDAGGEFGCAG
jgi:hypothetical protein